MRGDAGQVGFGGYVALKGDDAAGIERGGFFEDVLTAAYNVDFGGAVGEQVLEQVVGEALDALRDL